MPKNLLCVFLALTFLGACAGTGSSTTAGGGGGDDTTDTTGPTDQPPAPGEEGTEVIGIPGLCEAGSVARLDLSNSGKSRFSLEPQDDASCATDSDVQRKEYTAIFYNTTGSPISFRIDAPSNATEIESASGFMARAESLEVKPPTSNFSYSTGVNPLDQEAATAAKVRRAKGNKGGLAQGGLTNGLMAGLSVGDEVVFRVLDNTGDLSSFKTTSAVLRAQSTRLNIFVDRDHPVGSVNADALSVAALTNIASVFDNNIYPLVTNLLGEPSDRDGDGRISFIITPIVNKDLKVSAYFDARNLEPFDSLARPTSNECECAFIFAPDSLANYKQGGNGITAAEFQDKAFNAWIAYQFTHMVSYNQHVFANGGGSPEEDWVNDGLGALMADLAGFNIWRPSAYHYLTQPSLWPLKLNTTFDYAQFIGPRYLFFLYLLHSQMDATVSDGDGDGFDDDLDFLQTLMTSQLIGEDNIANAAEIEFDEEEEVVNFNPEFAEAFRQFAISVMTSGTNRSDLQVSGQTAVTYFQGLNSTLYGSGVANASGSVRSGADGGALDTDSSANAVGLDLNLFHTEEEILIENANELTWAPGNESKFFYVDPGAFVPVRIAGLMMDEQPIAIAASSASLRGFLLRRTDVSFPRVYSESIFGATDQRAEYLYQAGPNPYWTNQGNAQKVDLSSLIQTAGVGEASQESITIVGQIDPADTLLSCPASTQNCAAAAVPDTDKFEFIVPDLGARTDEGQLGIVVKRHFDNGSDESGLKPFLAVVSSKDVPYPWAVHPARSTVAPETRQQYRWLTSQVICGDDESNLRSTVIGQNCAPMGVEDSPRIILEEGGLVEPTTNILIEDGSSGLTAFWDGDVEGLECNNTPNLSQNAPQLVSTTGYGDGDGTVPDTFYPVTDQESSPSSLGGYAWSGSLMTWSFDGDFFIPDVILNRSFLKSSAGYPFEGSATAKPYDPRSRNGLTLNCHFETGAPEGDEIPDTADDFLQPNEWGSPGNLAEQILAEMARSRFSSGGTAESALMSAEYVDNDVFAIDGDSRDNDEVCASANVGNNLVPSTVRTGEGSWLVGGINELMPHIKDNLNASSIPFEDPTPTVLSWDSQQAIYSNGGQTLLTLTPGKAYTIIVGGTGDTTGAYEIQIRKINPVRDQSANFVDFENSAANCDFEL